MWGMRDKHGGFLSAEKEGRKKGERREGWWGRETVPSP